MTTAEPERTLSERELNRALLARQHLLERATTETRRALDDEGEHMRELFASPVP